MKAQLFDKKFIKIAELDIDYQPDEPDVLIAQDTRVVGTGQAVVRVFVKPARFRMPNEPREYHECDIGWITHPAWGAVKQVPSSKEPA